ncbi:hypothetical protein BY996DRAFT_7588968 [Phakopsora pachyrhizi]|uniref:Expressed protein n=1 Tax=Phakopsora pachyrhizi TaxID=170000 RepID=A0AAV0B4X8_PHAPC|nr:hypothetical protein BY996DRAFT_7588968 [Phakopsora pachyrhizi]CAH7677253.1 expressed protein [Phakopsora pachyrhizi]
MKYEISFIQQPRCGIAACESIYGPSLKGALPIVPCPVVNVIFKSDDSKRIEVDEEKAQSLVCTVLLHSCDTNGSRLEEANHLSAMFSPSSHCILDDRTNPLDSLCCFPFGSIMVRRVGTYRLEVKLYRLSDLETIMASTISEPFIITEQDQFPLHGVEISTPLSLRLKTEHGVDIWLPANRRK